MSIARLMQQAAAGGVVETDPNFANVSLLLHGDGTSGAQNNTFLDGSTNNFTITRNGNTTQGSFSPYNVSGPYDPATHGGSGYFDGAGDYLSYPTTTTASKFEGADFTLEAWVYITDLSSISTLYSGRDGSNRTGPIFRIGTTGQVAVALASSSGAWGVITTNPTEGNSVSLNQWSHIAVTREGTSLRVFIDGVLSYTKTINFDIYWPSLVARIGDDAGGGGAMSGYISDLRMVKGTALYTAAFTPPTAPLTAVSGTSLLCNFTNAGIFDSTGKNVLETVGNAQIDTAVTKFGTGSMEFDGTGDWLKAPNSTELQFGTGDFTVEFWVYLATGDAGSNRGLVAKGGASTGWLVSLNTSENVVFTYTTSTITSTGSINLDAWNHIAVVREGTGSNETKIYINGTNDGTGTVSTNFNQTEVMYIGANRAAGDPMKGYIDDLRITKGVARYTAAFTPPTKAFPDQ